MKNFLKILFVLLLINVVGQMKAANKGSNPGNSTESSKNSDTTIGNNSNIVIFRMISSTPNIPSHSNGSLKKAGKVARTSGSHASIDTFLFEKKGI